jgi:hypothetical protein
MSEARAAYRPTQLDMLDGRRKRRAPKLRTPEHVEQVTLMQWARLHERRYPELALLHAVPNGGHRHVAVARAMKAEGVKAGVPDLDLPVARGPWHGLRIEMKAKGGRATPEQRRWIDSLRAQGYRAEVCTGWEAARDLILEYLGGAT